MNVVTAEPRMEDLLASIRRAIQDDIGDLPLAAPSRDAPNRPKPAHRVARVGDELAAAASDIRQLRDRLSQPQAGLSPRERAQSIVETIQTASARRNLQEAEHAAAPRMRSSVAGREISARSPARAAPSLDPARHREEETCILSDQSSQAVQSSFGRLAGSVAARSVDGQAVEDMTRDMLRGMLKQWLDDNLPSMVERLVREEIERVARTGR